MAIKYPEIIKTDTDKVDWLYRAQEKLRIEHNTMGQTLNDGGITQEQWLAYKGEFRAKNCALCEEIAPLRTVLYEDLSDAERSAAKSASKTSTKHDDDIDLELVIE